MGRTRNRRKVIAIEERWAAGRGRCGICFKPMPQPTKPLRHAKGAPTIDHVFPKSPRSEDLRRIARLRALVYGKRRKVVAHATCNRRKDNRAPTACEVIFLMAVNERLRGHGPEDEV